MKLSVLLLASLNAESDNDGGVARCGTELSDETIANCETEAAARGETWSPPLCDGDSACRAADDDPCSYSCVAKDECDGAIISASLIGDDKIYCNCVAHDDPPRFGMYWSCDNTPVGDTQHQFGFARVPDILREQNDERQISILSMELERDLQEIVAENLKLEMFGISPCTGVAAEGADGLGYVEFANLFNHAECAPDCEVDERNGTLVETCRTIVGYDDLFHTLPSGPRVRLQAGDWWDFTCTRKLTGEVGDEGGVEQDDSNDDSNDIIGESSNEFSLELMCCDPSDPECNQCNTETNRTHIMRISPNADPDDSFFIDIKMENQERDEYIHIEECMYTERDDFGEQVGDSILLIEDGCDLSGGLIQFKERTEAMQYQEQFFMKPFQIEDQIANTFDINCKLAACAKGENVDGFCVLGDACKERYATIGLDSVPSGTNDVQLEDTIDQLEGLSANRRRRDVTSTNANVNGLHPCTYVSEGVQVCIVEEGEDANANNCWTVDNCRDPSKRQLNKFEEEVEAESGAMTPTSIAGLVGLVGLTALLK